MGGFITGNNMQLGDYCKKNSQSDICNIYLYAAFPNIPFMNLTFLSTLQKLQYFLNLQYVCTTGYQFGINLVFPFYT